MKKKTKALQRKGFFIKFEGETLDDMIFAYERGSHPSGSPDIESAHEEACLDEPGVKYEIYDIDLKRVARGVTKKSNL